MSWTVLARHPDLSIAGVLSGWSFSLTVRLNEVGSWTLNIPRERCPANWPAPGSGVIFQRDGVIVASGNVDEDAFAWSADPTSDDVGAGSYALTGDTDLGRLAYRIVYPEPLLPWSQNGNAGTWGTPATHYTTTDVASTVVRRLASRNAMSDATVDRRVPGLRLATQTPFGPTITAKERFTPLLDALRTAALAGGGLVFDVRATFSQTMEFSVRAPADRTQSALFGVEVGNVAQLDVKRVSPVATVALLGGQIDSAAPDPADSSWRRTFEKADPAGVTTWGRRELFVDQRGNDEDPAGDAEEFNKAADEALADNGEQTAVSAVIIDTPAVRWGRDFDLGDTVSVLTPFGQISDLVREIAISVDPTGVEDIATTIGTQSASAQDPLAATVAQLSKRISQIERAL